MDSQVNKGRKRITFSRVARASVFALAAWLLLSWVAARALIVNSEPAQSDAIAILAGSSTYVERARWAARLFHEGRAPKIILTNDGLRSGWSVAQQRNPFFAERAADELRRMGVPSDRVEIITQPVSSTHEEAVRLREYAVAHNLGSMLVVSNAYQSRRALWTLRRVFEGSNVDVRLDAHPTGEQTPSPATWWWHRLGWQLVPGEYLKMAYYLMHY
ncbi:MAG: YdcF family protein [Pyrinomonadaceae bacterium]